MCLRNNRKLGVFNGMQGRVLDHYKNKKRHFIDFESNGTNYSKIHFDPEQFGQEKTITEYDKDGPLPFDYAYASTCHKIQGSQRSRILVVEQVCRGWNHLVWRYTAASRAMEKITWVVP